MVEWTHVALASLWGGLLALERRAFLQAMFSRPLVAATGMGLLLNDVPSGLFVGMVLELFFLGTVSLGAVVPENDTLAATTAAAASAAMGNSLGGGVPATWSIAILLFVWMGRVGRWTDRALEAYSTRLASRAVQSAELGNVSRAVRQNLWGMWPHFFTFGALTALAAIAGDFLAMIVPQLPLALQRGLSWAYPAMASVAAAAAARSSRAQQGGLYAAAAAAVVTLAAALLSVGAEPW